MPPSSCTSHNYVSFYFSIISSISGITGSYVISFIYIIMFSFRVLALDLLFLLSLFFKSPFSSSLSFFLFSMMLIDHKGICLKLNLLHFCKALFLIPPRYSAVSSRFFLLFSPPSLLLPSCRSGSKGQTCSCSPPVPSVASHHNIPYLSA